MITAIEHRMLSNNLVEVVISFQDGKTTSMYLTPNDLLRLSFFVDCLSMELEGIAENEYR